MKYYKFRHQEKATISCRLYIKLRILCHTSIEIYFTKDQWKNANASNTVSHCEERDYQ